MATHCGGQRAADEVVRAPTELLRLSRRRPGMFLGVAQIFNLLYRRLRSRAHSPGQGGQTAPSLIGDEVRTWTHGTSRGPFGLATIFFDRESGSIHFLISA